MGRISGPLMDRFDLRIELPPVSIRELNLQQEGESSAEVAARVLRAHEMQRRRFAGKPGLNTNADAEGSILDEIARPDAEGRAMLIRAAESFGLSARGYHRILRVARTIADLDGSEQVRHPHLAEALSYRLVSRRAA